MRRAGVSVCSAGVNGWGKRIRLQTETVSVQKPENGTGPIPLLDLSTRPVSALLPPLPSPAVASRFHRCDGVRNRQAAFIRARAVVMRPLLRHPSTCHGTTGARFHLCAIVSQSAQKELRQSRPNADFFASLFRGFLTIRDFLVHDRVYDCAQRRGMDDAHHASFEPGLSPRTCGTRGPARIKMQRGATMKNAFVTRGL